MRAALVLLAAVGVVWLLGGFPEHRGLSEPGGLRDVAQPATAPETVPFGCPVRPDSGRVVMTQGYGVGTHAPADIWGAIDLAVDGNGDGVAEPKASWNVPIVAMHDGTATVTLNSYPAGNHVWVYDPTGTWRTGYAHLARVDVANGQVVRAGDQLGLMGSTGMSSGPHLDVQVWRAGPSGGWVNVDPTPLVSCPG